MNPQSIETYNETIWNGRKKGHYEVYFFIVNDPKSRAGLWLRYAIHVPQENQPPTAELWALFFNRQNPEENFALKESVPLAQTRIEKNPFSFQIDSSFITNQGVEGKIAKENGSISWKLSWEQGPFPLLHLPYLWMYSKGFPKTKVLSPNPHIHASGEVKVHGKSYFFHHAPALQSHLWGNEYASKWVWCHCNFFSQEEAFFEGLSAQVELGSFLLPPITVFFFYFQNKLYLLNSFSSILKNRSRSHLGLWRFWGEGMGIRLEGEATALPQWMLGAQYTGPKGEKRWCHSTKVGDLSLRVLKKQKKKWVPLTYLTSHGNCAVEWLQKTPDPRVSFWL